MSPETMLRFKINPNVGVGPVLLGMTREEVRNALSDCTDIDQASHPILDYAFGNSLQIEYDEDGHAHFIGVGYYSGCGCDFEFNGRHIGAYNAIELFALLSELDGGEHSFNSAQYFFPNIMMNLWDADTQYDYLGGETNPVYGQIGVANQNYCDNIPGNPNANNS